MKKKATRWILLGLCLVLVLIYIFAPSAAQATNLDQYFDGHISYIKLIPRPGSQDPEILVEDPDEIQEIIHWFSRTKVRPLWGIERGGGRLVDVIFYLNNGDRLGVSVSEPGCYMITTSHAEDTASLLPLFGDGFWSKLLAK